MNSSLNNLGALLSCNRWNTYKTGSTADSLSKKSFCSVLQHTVNLLTTIHDVFEQQHRICFPSVLQSVHEKKGRDACFISTVHYMKLFGPPLAEGQDKHTAAWGRKSIWFTFKQASLYTCRIKRNHPITLHSIHTIMTGAPPEGLFHCRKEEV